MHNYEEIVILARVARPIRQNTDFRTSMQSTIFPLLFSEINQETNETHFLLYYSNSVTR